MMYCNRLTTMLSRRSRTASAYLVLLVLLILAGQAPAGNLSDPEFRAEVASRFEDVSPDEITPSPVEGLWRIMSQGKVGYITANGRYLIEGELYDLKTNTNLSAQARRAYRLQRLAEIDPDNMIIYHASDRPADPAQVLTVFTDVGCPYCRHLHANIERLLDAGIEVHYLAFPLAGPGSRAFSKARQVWCADDRRRALTRAMQGKPLPSEPDCDPPVLEQYRLAAIGMSLTATPAIIAANGQVLASGMPIPNLIETVRQIDRAGG